MSVSTFFTVAAARASVFGCSTTLPPLSASTKGSAFQAKMSPTCIVRSAVNTMKLSPSVWPRPK